MYGHVDEFPRAIRIGNLNLYGFSFSRIVILIIRLVIVKNLLERRCKIRGMLFVGSGSRWAKGKKDPSRCPWIKLAGT